MKNTGIAILGYGVVGSGVAELVTKNSDKNIYIEKILDIRDIPDDRYAHLLTKKQGDILENPNVKIVVETIGGTGVAYELTKKALSAGKHVVTSNKDLVAAHGPELLKIADEKGVRYLFE